MVYNPVKSIIARATKKQGEPYHVLTAVTHSIAESELAKANIILYGYRDTEKKVLDWNYCRKPPSNYYILDRGGDEVIPKNVVFDCCLSQSPEAHYPYMKRYSQMFHIPLINLFHTCPPYWIGNRVNGYIQQVRQTCVADFDVCITESSRDQWQFKPDECTVIRHSANTTDFRPLGIEREDFVLTVANMYRSRDYALGYSLYNQITEGLNRLHVGADEDPSFSQPINDVAELNKLYNRCGVFLSTSIWSPIPCATIEALSAGAPCVLCSTCEIPIVLEHKKDCLMYPPNRPDLARKYIEMLLKDRELAARLGANARETVKRVFDTNRFINQWNELLERATNTPYRGI